MLQVQLKIIGRVQGVFYRAHAQKTAQSLGLTGWAKNEPDGTVSVLVQGDATAIDAFIEWAKQGSPSSRVEEVQLVEQEKTTVPFKDFTIH